MALRPLLTTMGAAVVTAALALSAVPVRAQDMGHTVSPILTIDRDQLYAGTAYGQRMKRELDAASQALADQTRQIEAALEKEEESLTEKRATLPADEFRTLADAFDQKVQTLRSDREKAQSDMQAQIEQAQIAFFKTIGPVLGQLVRERGAVLILDRRAILLAAADVDITREAIARIDAVLGDGSTLDNGVLDNGTPTPDPAPDPGPDPNLGLDAIPAPAEPVAQPQPTAPAAEPDQPQ